MPMAPPKSCPCGGKITDGKCDRCKPAPVVRSAAARRYHRLYNSRRWRGSKKQPGLRNVILARDPVCVLCERQGVIRPSEVVDHIKPHRGNMRLFHDPWNLQGLCKECHDRKSARE